jgi:bla regulator protein blaR1
MAFSQSFIAGVDTLGAVLLHFLWQGTALGLLYLALRPICVQVSARYRLGMAILVALASCPLITAIYLWPAAGVADAASASPLFFGTISAVVDRAAPSWHYAEMLPWLVAAWMSGVCIIGMRSLLHWRRLARLVRYAATPLPQWEERLKSMCKRFGLLRPVRLLCSASVATPMLLGWFRPVILLPLSMLSGFSPHQIELIIAHELGHVRRWDFLANLFQVVVETVLFYHPVVHWISRDVRNARESCCDDLVLSLGSANPITYARALADLEELRHDLDLVAPALGASGGVLLARIRRIVGAEGHDPLPRSNGWPVMLIAVAVAFLALRSQHLAPDLAAALVSAPAQSVAIASGNPRLALAPAASAPSVVVPASVPQVVAKQPPAAVALPEASAPAVASEVSAPVRVQIEQPRIEKVSFAAGASVGDIAQRQVLPSISLPVADDALAATVSELPTRLRVVPPVYPERAKESHVEGNVQLQFAIAGDGSVQNVKVLHAQPAGVFDDAARAALAQWRFGPSSDPKALFTQNFAFTLAGSPNNTKCQQTTGTMICRRPED